jgi:flagellar hook-associated protein 1 FlgK
MDVRVVPGNGNQVTIFTSSGVQLVGQQAARLEFDAKGTMTASAQWDADPSKRSVGTLTLVSPNGDSMDLLASGSIRSGAIAAHVEMRDKVLVEAQRQLDTFAAAMAQSLSNTTEAGTAASAGAQGGFDLDLSGVLAGNTATISYTDVVSGTQKSVTFVRVDDPAALPLNPGTDPNNRIVGINFAGGPGSVATQVAAALGANFTVSNPSGSTLRILDDGGVAVTMNAASVTKTSTGFATGNVQLPLFVDGSVPYTGAYTSGGAQLTGLASRIAVNAAVLSDSSKMVLFGPATLAGDATRPTFLYNQLAQTSLGVGGGVGSPPALQTTLPNFLRQIIVQQGQDAAAAANLREGQQVVVDALQQRMDDSSQVNVDQEMAMLLALQSAYSANARVLSAIKDMLDILERM